MELGGGVAARGRWGLCWRIVLAARASDLYVFWSGYAFRFCHITRVEGPLTTQCRELERERTTIATCPRTPIVDMPHVTRTRTGSIHPRARAGAAGLGIDTGSRTIPGLGMCAGYRASRT